jgi:hypothetical protein
MGAIMLPVTARAEVAEGELPGGKAALALQCAGEFILRFAEGHISEQGASELTRIMQAQIDSGTWVQNWAEPGSPIRQLKAG